MASFCAHCGAPHQGGAFCGSCGRPLGTAAQPGPTPDAGPAPEQPTIVPGGAPAPDPTTRFPSVPPQAPPPPYAAAPPPGHQPPPAHQPPPGYPPQPGPPQGQPLQGYPQQGYPQQGYPQQGYPQQPPAPRVNPFQGWPVADYLRDAASAVALFSALGMPWDLGSIEGYHHGGERWWVVIAVLLGVASLAVPYLAKARVVPGWGPTHYTLTKLALNAPLGLCVLAALLVELIEINDDGRGGLGSAVAMALTGVALAVQPRAAEESPQSGSDRLWTRIASGTAVGAVVLTVVLFTTWFLHGVVTDDFDLFDPFLPVVAVVVLFLLTPLALLGYPVFQSVLGARSDAWRRVLATTGFTVVVVALLSRASDGDGLFTWFTPEKWNGVAGGLLPGGGGLLAGAAAALAVSRAQQRATATPDALASWRDTVSAALQLSAAGSALTAVALLLDSIETGFEAGPVVVVVLLLAAAGAAGFALTLLGDLRAHRIVLLGVLAGIVVIGFVALGILNGEDLTEASNGWTVAAWLSLPCLAAYALTVPPTVRSALGPLVPQSGSPAPHGQPQGYPQQPYPPQGHPQQGHPQQGHPQQGPPQPYPPQQGRPPQPPPGYQQGPPPAGWTPPPGP
ncbi:zinc ribbon domain-containing protein [Nocardioides sp. 1609]|uniref:zinc ribbon domain-containing protein n=1 Tax=Nocardioides sp. 1609 TaxID=2508327 RepID=UPI001ADBD3C1|nr:zinc ribbon domain-containing protein [Nocardioides sp. 1609]